MASSKKVDLEQLTSIRPMEVDSNSVQSRVSPVASTSTSSTNEGTVKPNSAASTPGIDAGATSTPSLDAGDVSTPSVDVGAASTPSIDVQGTSSLSTRRRNPSKTTNELDKTNNTLTGVRCVNVSVICSI